MFPFNLNMLRGLWTRLPQIVLGDPRPSNDQLLYLFVALLHVWTACCHALRLHFVVILGCTELAIAIAYLLFFRHKKGK
jgi:hypothetical protein